MKDIFIFCRIGRFQIRNNSFFEKSIFFGQYQFFFDSDRILSIGNSCAHYTFNLISFGRLFESEIGATKSPEGETLKIVEKIQNFQIE